VSILFDSNAFLCPPLLPIQAQTWIPPCLSVSKAPLIPVRYSSTHTHFVSQKLTHTQKKNKHFCQRLSLRLTRLLADIVLKFLETRPTQTNFNSKSSIKNHSVAEFTIHLTLQLLPKSFLSPFVLVNRLSCCVRPQLHPSNLNSVSWFYVQSGRL